MITSGAGVDRPTVRALLRQWRKRRRLSQLQLSHQAEVSTRHLSYIETGRSRPTPEMIVRLAEHLEVPVRARNELLLSGGYAPRYRARPPEDASVAAVMAGLRGLLDAHLPSPALLLDEQWDIVDAKRRRRPAPGRLRRRAARAAGQCDPGLAAPAGTGPADPQPGPVGGPPAPPGLPPGRADPGSALLALVREIRSLVELPAGTRPGPEPVLVLEIEAGSQLLRFFTVAARLETARDTTLEGLHLETFLAADARTAAALSAREGPSRAQPASGSGASVVMQNG